MSMLKRLFPILLILTLVFTCGIKNSAVFADEGSPVVTMITDPDNVTSINYKGSPDNGYIYIRLMLGGENLDKLSKSDFAFEIDGERVELDDSSEYSWENQFDIYSAEADSAEVHIAFPENDLEEERICTIEVLCAPEATEGRVRTLTMAAKPESTENRFQIKSDKWSASDLGNGTFRVHIEEPKGVTLSADPSDYKHYEDFYEAIKDFIYFSDAPGSDPSERRYITVNDRVTAEDGDIIVSLADTSGRIPYYINFAKGSLKNAEGKTLGYDEYRRDHNRYIITGPHIDSISYNRITFGSEGGEVVAVAKGTMLNSGVDTVSGKVFVDGDKETSQDIIPEITVSDDGKSAEFRFNVPANDTDRTRSYRLTPVINGTNTVSQYIKGYDIISVLPQGGSEDDVTLSSVEIQGAYDMDDALDVFKTSTSSEQFTTKIDAVIRGTNLSSKKTLVKAVDENGITWPMLPVFECGATIRWQSSAYYLPEKESKNEQHIELLLPRRLGVTRTFRLYFAPDGKNYNESITATVIVENEGLYDTDSIGSGIFRESDFTEVRDIEVKYVDEQGKKLAESDHFAGYGITELYHMGIKPKEIEGYKVKSYSPADLEKMLAQPVQHESGEFVFPQGQWFVKDLKGSPIVYVYSDSNASGENDGHNGQIRGKESTVKVADTNSGEIIDLPPVRITKPKAVKKGMTVKWKKISKKNKKKISKVQIQYSTDKSFTSADTKIKFIKKSKKSVKIKKLRSKTAYYVRIRSYKIIDGKIHLSNWSKIKKVRTK